MLCPTGITLGTRTLRGSRVGTIVLVRMGIVMLTGMMLFSIIVMINPGLAVCSKCLILHGVMLIGVVVQCWRHRDSVVKRLRRNGA